MPAPLRSFAVREFTGGLNLRADQFQVGPNESPNLLNMDIDPRGGLKLRSGIAPWGIALAAPIEAIGAFYGTDGEHQVLAQQGTSIKWTDDGESWATVTSSNTTTYPVVFTQMKDALYVQNGTDKPIKWTGTTATRLNQGWANDVAEPGSGQMPIARSMVSHNGYIFVANTLEGGIRQPNRVRFSHLGQPEAWRQVDFFDVDPGVDGDEIVALVPFTDHLLVFKRRSTYVVYGFDADSFQLQAASREVGAVAARAVAATPQGVYFFAERAGVMFYDGRSIQWQFEKLIPALDSGDISPSRLGEVTAGWLDNRAWFSVPWIGGTSRVFVYDPSLGRGGAWTRYQFPDQLGAMLPFGPLGAVRILGAMGNGLVELAVQDQPHDTILQAVEPEWTDDLDVPNQAEARSSRRLLGVVDPLNVQFGILIDGTAYGSLIVRFDGTTLYVDDGMASTEIDTFAAAAEAAAWLGTHLLLMQTHAVRDSGGLHTYTTSVTVDGAVVYSKADELYVPESWTPTPSLVHTVNYGTAVLGPQVTEALPEGGEVAEVEVHIDSVYVTPWTDAGEVAVRKRWRRPWFVFLGETDDVVECAVFLDYDGSKRTKTFYPQISSVGSSGLWDDEVTLWDGGTVWGGEGKAHSIERGSTVGQGHSIQLHFRGPKSNAVWGLDNITYTFIPRKLR